MSAAAAEPDGVSALHILKSADAPLFLSPSADLSAAARAASQHLFTSLRPYTPKSPFDSLLVDGFDAEQIWQQIDLQSSSLISKLSKHVVGFEKNPKELEEVFGVKKKQRKEGLGLGLEKGEESEGEDVKDEELEGFDDEDEDLEGFGDEDEEMEGFGDEDEEDDEDDGEEEVDEEDGDELSGSEVEDEFLKRKDMEAFIEDGEDRAAGIRRKKKGGKKVEEDEEEEDEDDDHDDEDEDEDEDDDEDLELRLLGMGDEDDVIADGPRYEDFYGSKSKTSRQKKPTKEGGKPEIDDVQSDDPDFNEEKKGNLSTHEKELERQRAEIKEMERENLEPKTWTMQGEVTAGKRPINSALEVDLDFEHNVAPAPVITEEVTQSLEELIQTRISEGRFDDIKRTRSLPAKAPREVKELDENKSKKGLAEEYGDLYAQKTGLVSEALSSSNELQKECTASFKKICLKIDIMSHFHFSPKPVIEDLSIQANVPALAMEEIAPLAVSDAAMLAPEEVFSGKGVIKEEAELTKAERKRRRANKKRKFKARGEGIKAKKARTSTLEENDD